MKQKSLAVLGAFVVLMAFALGWMLTGTETHEAEYGAALDTTSFENLTETLIELIPVLIYVTIVLLVVGAVFRFMPRGR